MTAISPSLLSPQPQPPALDQPPNSRSHSSNTGRPGVVAYLHLLRSVSRQHSPAPRPAGVGRGTTVAAAAATPVGACRRAARLRSCQTQINFIVAPCSTASRMGRRQAAAAEAAAINEAAAAAKTTQAELRQLELDYQPRKVGAGLHEV